MNTSRRWLITLVTSCTISVAAAMADPPETDLPSTRDHQPQTPAERLHQLTVTDSLIVGASPETSVDLEWLKQQGVTTVVSVDGATPPVEQARAVGLRYIHIPFGYDGIPPSQAAQLTRISREAKGKVFVHCHHGKHRGPAAAAICGLSTGAITHAQAIAVLNKAGTSEAYTGLWRDVAAFTPPAQDAPLPPLVEVAEVEPMTTAMVRIDTLMSKLQSQEETKAKQHDPAESSLLLWEEFRELLRSEAVTSNDDLHQQMQSATGIARKLHAAATADDTTALQRHLASLSNSCTTCHEAHRDR